MCKKTYFNHDCDARNDEKLIALRIRYGAEGYGLLHAHRDAASSPGLRARERL